MYFERNDKYIYIYIYKDGTIVYINFKKSTYHYSDTRGRHIIINEHKPLPKLWKCAISIKWGADFFACDVEKEAPRQ